MLRLQLSVVAILLMIGIVSPSYATVKYGSKAANAALQFDPFNPTKPLVADDSFLSVNPPILVPQAGSVQPASVTPLARTPVDPTTPILDVVDAPRVFEGPYLTGVKASFVVTLRAAAKTVVTVKYRTLNGTGRAGIEYASKTGTLTFQPGERAKIVNVDVLNDDLVVLTNVPGPRTFFLEIFSPTGADIGRSKGTAEIVENGKGQVGITVSNALPVFELGSNVKAIFTVTLNQTSSNTVKVNYQTVNGTATAGSDYTATNGTLTFSPGQTIKQVQVSIIDNTTPPEDIVETFFLKLSSPVNAILLRTQATGEIVEYTSSAPTPTPVVSITPAFQAITEGNSGTKAVNFTVKLNGASASTVKVNYSTANAGASSASDYNIASGTLTFLPGQLSKTVTVLVKGDTAVEGNENFKVNLFSPLNATLGTATSTVTINNDD